MTEALSGTGVRRVDPPIISQSGKVINFLVDQPKVGFVRMTHQPTGRYVWRRGVGPVEGQRFTEDHHALLRSMQIELKSLLRQTQD